MTSLGNYTGPYISDGKFQESVEWGDAPTLNPMDEASRRHDSAYAKWSDIKHRKAADIIYKREMDTITKNQQGLTGLEGLAGTAVLYGNEALRQGGDIQPYLTYTPGGMLAGLLVHEAKWLYGMNKDLNDMHKRRTYLHAEQAEVEKYYKQDPKIQTSVKQTADAGYHGQTTISKVPTVSRAHPSGGDDFTVVRSDLKPSSGEDATGNTAAHAIRWLRRVKKRKKRNKVVPGG